MRVRTHCAFCEKHVLKRVRVVRDGWVLCSDTCRDAHEVRQELKGNVCMMAGCDGAPAMGCLCQKHYDLITSKDQRE